MDYLNQLWAWILSFLLNAKTFTLAATILGLYAQFLRGELDVTALQAAIWAAVIAWLSASVVHGGAKRTGLMK